jgi:two-component SAPR family response regulator
MPKLSEKKLQRRLEAIHQFREAHHNTPASSLQIAEWAIEHKILVPQRVDFRKQLARELAQTMREEYFTDPQGRRVRAMHVAEDLWVDMRDKGAEVDKLKVISFQNRRQQVVGDCRQLKTDVDSFNENYNRYEAPFQLILDFKDDVTELELAMTAKV